MNFDETIQLQILRLKASTSGRGPILEHMLDTQETPEVRQMCAKVSVQMYADLESVVSLLDMTKREFIEQAVGDALKRAHAAINASGVIDQLTLGD